MPIKGENSYKRKDHRWEGRYIRDRKPDGSICYGYCYAKTYWEVKQKLAAASKLDPETARKSKSNHLLSTFCDEWLQLCWIRVKESTLVKYSGFLEKYIKPRLGNYTISELSRILVDQFSHELLALDGLSSKTVRDILTVLHGVLRYAANDCPEAAALHVAYPPSVREEMRVLSREEQDMFVAYLLEHMDLCRFGVLLTLMTGMRIGEVCALRWKDISIENKTIRISATMQRVQDMDPERTKKTKIIITNPKSSCGFRLIPLTEQAMVLCRRYICGDTEAFVLTGHRDRYLEPRVMQYRFRKYATECGLEDVHFHTLRHTFATRCVEVDFEIKTLSEIMGHASPKVTLERYIHASMRLKRENMNKLNLVGL